MIGHMFGSFDGRKAADKGRGRGVKFGRHLGDKIGHALLLAKAAEVGLPGGDGAGTLVCRVASPDTLD